MDLLGPAPLPRALSCHGRRPCQQVLVHPHRLWLPFWLPWETLVAAVPHPSCPRGAGPDPRSLRPDTIWDPGVGMVSFLPPTFAGRHSSSRTV